MERRETEDLEVFKSKRLSRGTIREDPISLKHICLLNILPSLVLAHQKVWGLCLVTWNNSALVLKGNENCFLNSLLINSSAIWEVPAPPHPVTVRWIYVKGCICPLITQAHNQTAPFTEQFWWVLPGLQDHQGLWTWLCFCEDATWDWGPYFCTDILAFWPMTQLYLALLHSCG